MGFGMGALQLVVSLGFGLGLGLVVGVDTPLYFADACELDWILYC